MNFNVSGIAFQRYFFYLYLIECILLQRATYKANMKHHNSGTFPGKLFQRGLIIAALLLMFYGKASAVEDSSYVAFSQVKGCFRLAEAGNTAPVVISASDFEGVKKVAAMFRDDIQKVTAMQPAMYTDSLPTGSNVILIGTIEKNPLLDQLVRKGKLNLSGLYAKWEKFIITTVKDPFPGIGEALVIAGSDKRGTIYGMFDLSAQMGVSPWTWWADVPVKHRESVYVKPGVHTLGEPAVRYRGFFINDEAPALSGWVYEKFGGFNHRFYEKVFELLLRLKANYLWPAMWGNAFNDDDTINPRLADEYGIVMGTSHHEPMLRAQQEWKRYGKGEWNYEKNDSVLREFWRQGIRNMGKHESIITVGMRGDGDLPMSEESNIALLQKIIHDQRDILQQVTGRKPSEIPQLWALYKEVQDYYNKGMLVPDDITLLFCDDNWGNIRLLPKQDERQRKGGYGIYYHFDYVGGPRNYKWLNTNQIERTWEQMHLAYAYGVDRIWIVNVGDIKPMELPISFFLDYAWNPNGWPVDRMHEYTTLWAQQQFGKEYASSTASILDQYTKFNSRRKPELLSPETYSLINYNEAGKVASGYQALYRQALNIYQKLSPEYKDAFYQLVYFPVAACANLNELYYTVALNRLYAHQERAQTNELAGRAAKLFARDAELSREYNTELNHGKWNHMMDQTHIGYTYWQQPPENTMPKVEKITPLSGAHPGMAVSGSAASWPGEKAMAEINLDRRETSVPYIELFNRGTQPYKYTISSGSRWLHVSHPKGTVDSVVRIFPEADWTRVPSGNTPVKLAVSTTAGQNFEVEVTVLNPMLELPAGWSGFMESGRVVSMEAPHYSRAFADRPFRWVCIPNLGRTLSAMTLFPLPYAPLEAKQNDPHLEYNLALVNPDSLHLRVFVSPTQNFTGGPGPRYAVAFDDQKPVVVDINADQSLKAWEQTVADNINITVTRHSLKKPGPHVLKFWALDPGIALQKIVVETGKVPASYLGPPESMRFPVPGKEKNK